MNHNRMGCVRTTWIKQTGALSLSAYRRKIRSNIDLELDDWHELTINRYDVIVPDIAKPLAQATVAQRENGAPVLINGKTTVKRNTAYTGLRKSKRTQCVGQSDQAIRTQRCIIAGVNGIYHSN
ncbi:MAG: hypothetical protein MRJ52_05810 [Nitrosomonas sp.]|nr:hypothetical protein [Nitrosomonas sp.]